MATISLCKPTTNPEQTRPRFLATNKSAHHFPVVTSLITLKSYKSCSCRLKPLAQMPNNLECDVKKSKEPYVSLSQTSNQNPPLMIGIVGLGAFGQFLAKAFQRQHHNVLATSRSDYSKYCKEHDIQFFHHLNDLCDKQPDVLLVCSSILSTEDVVRRIPFHKLSANTIIADVLSVKQFPKNLLLEVVPSGFGILCTHPMFGKYSGKDSWNGLRFVYDKVQIAEKSNQGRKCEQFLNIFYDEGCRMVEMTCEEHDQYAAETQFLTHTVARILSTMKVESTPIDTKGYETLMELTKNAVSHGSDLYDGLFLYNTNSAKQIKKLETAFDMVKKKLFSKLRESFRAQLEETEVEKPAAPVQSSSGKILKDTSSFSIVRAP